MWADFEPSPRARRLSAERDGSRPRPAATVPEPFGMTLREAERRRRRCGLKTRAEVELENAELRRRLQEMSECRKQFRAGSVPAHVRLPLYEELRRERRGGDARRDRHLNTKVPRHFI